jgi:hypothetical protein
VAPEKPPFGGLANTYRVVSVTFRTKITMKSGSP